MDSLAPVVAFGGNSYPVWTFFGRALSTALMASYRSPATSMRFSPRLVRKDTPTLAPLAKVTSAPTTTQLHRAICWNSVSALAKRKKGTLLEV